MPLAGPEFHRVMISSCCAHVGRCSSTFLVPPGSRFGPQRTLSLKVLLACLFEGHLQLFCEPIKLVSIHDRSERGQVIMEIIQPGLLGPLGMVYAEASTVT